MIEAEVEIRQDGKTVAGYTGTRDALIAAGLATARMIPQRRSWHQSRKGAKTSWNSTRLPDGRWNIRYFGMLTAADLSEADEGRLVFMRQEVRRILDEFPDEDEGTELL